MHAGWVMPIRSGRGTWLRTLADQLFSDAASRIDRDAGVEDGSWQEDVIVAKSSLALECLPRT